MGQLQQKKGHLREQIESGAGRCLYIILLLGILNWSEIICRALMQINIVLLYNAVYTLDAAKIIMDFWKSFAEYYYFQKTLFSLIGPFLDRV